MMAADTASFVERQRRERVAAGLTPTITDESALRLIAAVMTNANRVGDRHAST